jgi:heme-degrading monooxygenase HmoA
MTPRSITRPWNTRQLRQDGLLSNPLVVFSNPRRTSETAKVICFWTRLVLDFHGLGTHSHLFALPWANIGDNVTLETISMIIRMWHGWTTSENAAPYESLLKREIFVGIQERQIEGYRGIQLLRRELGDEVEFITIMAFDSLDAIRAFAGQEYETAVVPEKAQALLSRYDAKSQHYEVRTEMRF